MNHEESKQVANMHTEHTEHHCLGPELQVRMVRDLYTGACHRLLNSPPGWHRQRLPCLQQAALELYKSQTFCRGESLQAAIPHSAPLEVLNLNASH